MANCDLRSEYKTRLLRLTGPNAAVKFNRKYKFYHQGATAQSFLILERKENANNFDALKYQTINWKDLMTNYSLK